MDCLFARFEFENSESKLGVVAELFPCSAGELESIVEAREIFHGGGERGFELTNRNDLERFVVECCLGWRHGAATNPSRSLGVRESEMHGTEEIGILFQGNEFHGVVDMA